MANTTSDSLHIRPARAGDRAGMLHITKGVWEGTDYVPYLWQRWLDDPSGYLSVATWDDNLVGLQHVDRQPDGSAWLEGIRVDDAMRGRGVGAALLQHGLLWARNAGCSVARLSTSSGNVSSIRLARRSGLREVARFDVLAGAASTASRPSLHVRLAHPGDLEALKLKLLQEWNTDASSSFYTEGWTAYRLTARRIELLVATHAIALVSQNGIEAVGIATASVGRPILRLGYLRGRIEGKTSIVAWMQQQAHAGSGEQIRAIIPADTSTEAALRSLGLIPRADFKMMLWEIEL